MLGRHRGGDRRRRPPSHPAARARAGSAGARPPLESGAAVLRRGWDCVLSLGTRLAECLAAPRTSPPSHPVHRGGCPFASPRHRAMGPRPRHAVRLTWLRPVRFRIDVSSISLGAAFSTAAGVRPRRGPTASSTTTAAQAIRRRAQRAPDLAAVLGALDRSETLRKPTLARTS